jgi:hypothetical protein
MIFRMLLLLAAGVFFCSAAPVSIKENTSGLARPRGVEPRLPG